MADPTLLNGRYQIEKTLGNGGMANVYRALDLTLERAVALKVLREDYSSDPAFRERFRQEATAAANLAHPNIVTVHDFGIDQGHLFIVMEYVPGTDLNSILLKRGRFTVDETLPLIRQACAGIGYAHRAGLVHCDVKPHNFLITPDNRLKVTDFGIARALASINPDEKTKIVWGSPQYFSPEQAAGNAPSPASDVYSLGVVMYYMLTGRLPFTAATIPELIEMHRSAFPTPPHRFNPAIPPTLEEIILKVLSKEASARYRTADQLGRVLMTFNEQLSLEPAGVRPVSKPVPSQPISQPSRKPPTSAATLHSPLPGGTTRQASTPPKPALSEAKPLPSSQETAATGENPLDIDWITLILGLLTFLAVGGLVPFCLWVYLVYNPLIK
jgi:eukaryotic-like serine/threonine-protein kinase